MKRQVFNKLIEVASMYWGFDFIHLFEATEMLIYKLKTTFKNSNNEKDNH